MVWAREPEFESLNIQCQPELPVGFQKKGTSRCLLWLLHCKVIGYEGRVLTWTQLKVGNFYLIKSLGFSIWSFGFHVLWHEMDFSALFSC